ncbi:DUF3710 domain-containing protein [Nocardia iowensis]|uniref:DUF3710 domain-containing protein n=1 Tax=Nocardia iowensis TaxID=204891 RepID=A0ABX8S1D4_NOCIO|nr:DUF3710 domain-containing protein [Nocardia iowensis]QXN94395.1 DUF3710 domain-containing protein [Nocardia iowensis]
MTDQLGGEGPARPIGPNPRGPYDEKDAPDDNVRRLDLRSIRIPVPAWGEFLVDMAPDDSIVRLVHWQTPLGRFTVTAYAAPSSNGLWEQVIPELMDGLRQDCRTVRREPGSWGDEVAATMGDRALRFVGIDGPGWMLRGAMLAPPATVQHSASALRDLLRGTVVARGADELPDRTLLPMQLPPEMAARIPGVPKDEAGLRSFGVL